MPNSYQKISLEGKISYFSSGYDSSPYNFYFCYHNLVCVKYEVLGVKVNYHVHMLKMCIDSTVQHKVQHHGWAIYKTLFIIYN